MPAERVAAHFETDCLSGLSRDAVDRLRARHGANVLPEPPRRPLWITFARQFRSPLIYILFAASVLAVALGHRGDALVILGVVLVNAMIGAFQEGRAERSMQALRRLAALHVRVVRGGSEQVVEARELVPGDIASESAGLADRHGMVYSGTHVSAGRARAVVVATGANTEVGRIADLTEGAVEPKTPLEQRLDQRYRHGFRHRGGFPCQRRLAHLEPRFVDQACIRGHCVASGQQHVMDPPDGDEMRRRPVARDDRLLDRLMLARTALMASCSAAVAFGWFAWRLGQGVPLDTVRTEVFTLVAMSQWFNVLNCQSATVSALGWRLLRNRWLLGGLVLSVALQALVLYAPPMNEWFYTVPLPLETMVALAALASVVLWAEEARKLLQRIGHAPSP